jgi:ankyrin repeat protein
LTFGQNSRDNQAEKPDCSLLEKEDIDINIKDNEGRTALIIASKCDKIDIFRLLCNFDLRSKFTGQTGFQPVCSLLEREDIDINLQKK